MTKPIFWDTSGFFALLDVNGQSHNKAVEISRMLKAKGVRTITTDYVASETYTLLKARGLNHLTPAFHHLLHSAEDIHILWTAPQDFKKAETFFLNYTDEDYSFTDCLSFIVMRDRKLTEALTADRHFEQAGFKALLAG